MSQSAAENRGVEKSKDLLKKYVDVPFILQQIAGFPKYRLPSSRSREGIVDWYLSNWRDFKIDLRPEIDCGFYREKYSEALGPEVEPFTHFVRYGYAEGLRPHPLIFTDFMKHHYGVATDDPEEFFATLSRGAHLNPLVSVEIPMVEWRAMLKNKNLDLSEYFTFDYGAWISAQQDVRRNYPRHPIEHLFRYGLGENRLTKSGAICSQLFRQGNRNGSEIRDLEWVSRAKGLIRETSFEKLEPLRLSPATAGARVAVGVVYYNNSGEEVRRLLRSIAGAFAAEELSLTYVAVDNAEEPSLDLVELHREILPETLLHVRRENPGFARGHNMLIEGAFGSGADYYVGLNPDGFLLRSALTNVVAFSKAWDDDALVEISSFPLGHPKWYHPTTGETAWVSGAAFMLPKKIYEAVGAFDPDFPMYGEDVDLSLRVRVAGFKTRVCPHARFYHDVVPRFGQADGKRKLRELIGNWYLCMKWGKIERAETLFREIRALQGGALPLREPQSRIVAPPEIERDLELPRYAHSRFWGA